MLGRMVDLDDLSAAIEVGDRARAVDLTRAAMAAGVAPHAILDAMTAAMGEVGDQFQANLIFVPEMLVPSVGREA